MLRTKNNPKMKTYIKTMYCDVILVFILKMRLSLVLLLVVLIWIQIISISIILYTSDLIDIVLFENQLLFSSWQSIWSNKKMCLYYTVYSTHYTVYYTDHSSVHQKQWEGKEKRKKCHKLLILIVQNLVLKITCRFCLRFANHVCQTNKLKTVHTLQCTLYTVHYVPHRPEFSTLETSKEGGHIGRIAYVTN